MNQSNRRQRRRTINTQPIAARFQLPNVFCWSPLATGRVFCISYGSFCVAHFTIGFNVCRRWRPSANLCFSRQRRPILKPMVKPFRRNHRKIEHFHFGRQRRQTKSSRAQKTIDKLADIFVRRFQRRKLFRIFPMVPASPAP